MQPWLTTARWYAHLSHALGRNERLRGITRLLRRIKSDSILQVDGLAIYLNHRVARCYIRLVGGRFNEPETHLFFRSILKDLGAAAQVHVIDVGANIGEISVDMARQPNVCKVIAFEPQAECAKACAVSGLLNDLDAKLTVRRVALSSRSGTVNFFCDVERPTNSGIVAEGGITVPASTLDEETSQTQAPCLLKIDVEGAELDVLRGGSAFLERVRPLIVFEYNGCGKSKYSLDDIKAALGADYHLFRLRSDGRLDEQFNQTWNCVAVHRESEFEAPCQALLVRSP